MALFFLPKSQLTSYTQAMFQQHAVLPPQDFSPSQRDARLRYFAEYTPEKFLEWCALYLPHAFSSPFATHHQVIAQAFQLKGQTVEVLISRGYGKTTMFDAFTLYSACYGDDQHVVRFEHDAKEGAKKGRLLEKELLYNPRIQQDYRLERGNVWRPNAGELELLNRHNPYAHHDRLYFRSVGVLNIARGTNYNFGRIDRAELNDVVKNRKEAMSVTWNDFLWHMIKEDLGFAGGTFTDAPISIFFLTTMQATNDISDRLRQDPTVLTYECPAIHAPLEDVKALVSLVSDDTPNIAAYLNTIQGTPETGLTGRSVTLADIQTYCDTHAAYAPYLTTLHSTWPERFSLYEHIWDMYRSGSAAWLQEKQHDVGDARFQRFHADWFVPYDGALPPGDYLYGIGVDPSGAPKEGTDPMAVVAGAYHTQTGNFYLLDVWCDQGTPEDLTWRVHDAYVRHFRNHGRKATVYLETIVSATGLGRAFFRQTAENHRLKGEDQAFWDDVPIIEVAQKEKKEVRILAMRPIAEHRKIHVQFGQSQQTLLVTQWTNWRGEPTHHRLRIEEKIDAPDAATLLYQQFLSGNRTPILMASPAKPPRRTAPPMTIPSGRTGMFGNTRREKTAKIA